MTQPPVTPMTEQNGLGNRGRTGDGGTGRRGGPLNRTDHDSNPAQRGIGDNGGLMCRVQTQN